ALAVNPVRVWLQGLVHRAFYGARDDPVRAFAAVGARLQEVGTDLGPGLEGVLEALCRALRLPAAAIVTDGRTVAARGSLPADRHAVTLPGVGELVVGVRSGDRRLGTDDERVLDLLAAPLTVAVQAERLADELRSSRERVVTGREEERRRIRRDLHDGLGPVLTGIVLNADTALRLLPTQPDRSAALLADLRTHAMRAIDEIRRVAYDLRPPVLDGMGVVGAIREYAAVLGRPEGGTELTVTVEAPEDGWPVLPAAVEVATYRIVTEALTNVVRHSSATAVTVRLEPDGPVLRLEVLDNGINAGPSWEPGVGLTSVRERTAELGGASELRYDRTGGQVRVTLPIGAAQTTPSGPFADQATS
ncbi:MAG TPA: histidine kinase, partial [Lapillicoccus sp.]